MKRFICIVLTIGILATFTGCQFPDSASTAAFYYLRHEDDFVYGTEDGVITPEQREISGREGDLQYMLTLYLEGPLDPTYVSPFPKHIQILELQQEDGILSIVLSEEFAVLADIDLTLACACIARTCFDLCDAEQVLITAQSAEEGDISITLTRDSLTLLDDSAAYQTTVPESTG